MSDSSNLDNKLKNEKLSFTQQRRVILEEIEKKDCHLTADEIYFVVKKRMPKVSVGTIYRNLSVLVELNLIDKVKTSLHDESYYEIHSDPHYHIICTKCLRIDDLEHYRALSITYRRKNKWIYNKSSFDRTSWYLSTLQSKIRSTRKSG